MQVILSGTLSMNAGGPALSTWLTMKGLQAHGVATQIIIPPIDVNDKIIDENARPILTSRPKFGTLAYVPNISKIIMSAGNADLYHIQGVWMLHGLSVSRYAKKHGKPYVVTLRGMLYPKALAHNAFVKRVSLALYQRRILREAALVQCTCLEEMEHFRNLGFKTPVAVIPNPIETTGVIDQPIPDKPVFTVGYLGRLHPRKRVERLIYAMSGLRGKLPENAVLRIIGGGDEQYTSFLQSEIKRLNLDNIEMTGFLSGKEKDDAIRSLSVLAVPSDFENFGNIVTEALVRGVPVIASKGMPWQELPANNCGWWIDNSQEEINKTIFESYSVGENRRKEMGHAGRDLIARNYSVASLGKKMEMAYKWILNGGEPPEFVFLSE